MKKVTITKKKLNIGIKMLGITYDKAIGAWYVKTEDYGETMLKESTNKKLDKLAEKWKLI